MSPISRENSVPEKLVGCHTALVGGYVVEGRVPISAINKDMTEGPNFKGISLPGTLKGSPGMTGQKTEPFTIYAISEDAKVFAGSDEGASPGYVSELNGIESTPWAFTPIVSCRCSSICRCATGCFDPIASA